MSDAAQDVDDLLPQLDVHGTVGILVVKSEMFVERQQLVNHELLVGTVTGSSAKHQADILELCNGSCPGYVVNLLPQVFSCFKGDRVV